MKVLFIDYDKCSGCRMCEVACSYEHERCFNPALARLHVISDKKDGINIPIFCTQCEKPACKEVCPSSAISRDPETGAWVSLVEKCIGCRLCVMACPVSAMGFHGENRVSIKCDLCNGNPKCVQYCQMKAILYIDEEKISQKRKRNTAMRLMEGKTL